MLRQCGRKLKQKPSTRRVSPPQSWCDLSKNNFKLLLPVPRGGMFQKIGRGEFAAIRAENAANQCFKKYLFSWYQIILTLGKTPQPAAEAGAGAEGEEEAGAEVRAADKAGSAVQPAWIHIQHTPWLPIPIKGKSTTCSPLCNYRLSSLIVTHSTRSPNVGNTFSLSMGMVSYLRYIL